MEIAILLYDNFTALDCIGPYEALSRLPGADLKFVSLEGGIVRSDTRMLAVSTDCKIDDVGSPDILLIPGGPGDEAALANERITDWVARVHETTQWTTSVCTGSLILGAAGVLRGLDATTHWASYDRLRDFGANPLSERFVRVGKVITAAGVSAGIDMALHLLAELQGDEFAQAIQLAIEYDPQPPFDSGSPAKAPAPVMERLIEYFGEQLAERRQA